MSERTHTQGDNAAARIRSFLDARAEEQDNNPSFSPSSGEIAAIHSQTPPHRRSLRDADLEALLQINETLCQVLKSYAREELQPESDPSP